MHREPDPDGPEIPDDRLPPDSGPDAFDAIVAGWREDGDVPHWPDEPVTDTPEPGDPRQPADPDELDELVAGEVVERG